MEMLVYAFAAYGLVFGIQQKLPFLRFWKLGDLLVCPYCLGFWAGWAVWGLSWLSGSPVFCPFTGAALTVVAGMVWSLAVAAACVVLDGLAEHFEEEP